MKYLGVALLHITWHVTATWPGGRAVAVGHGTVSPALPCPGMWPCPRGDSEVTPEGRGPLPDRCQQPWLCAGQGLFVWVFNICHFSPPLSSALTLAEGFSFLPFLPLFPHLLFHPRFKHFFPAYYAEVGTIWCFVLLRARRVPGPLSPSPSSSSSCLSNPRPAPKSPPPSPNKATGHTRARAGDGDSSIPGVPMSPSHRDTQPPASGVLRIIPVQILDSFLGPAVSRGILILFFFFL